MDSDWVFDHAGNPNDCASPPCHDDRALSRKLKIKLDTKLRHRKFDETKAKS